jgi:hypothetical protein
MARSVRVEEGRRQGIAGRPELGHGDPAQGSGTPAASKASKARAQEGEGVGEDVGARSCGRGGLTRRKQQRRRELHSVAAMAVFVRAAREGAWGRE